ncbi:helicase carboxy-terminal domain protein (macronuclear) [Tetrahymena thermophila SB210]|uniref:Helicase carboxy-terminal domain protein n=1 Tax=Tetrahymena thermophila (strain SB210) TaxID=312017 RepID=W7X535_TETTS|nr:helicase carboxy-terminal domain protein [Tetrahymena thermophila SB210]EWS74475.1 helicase carboxy-terminal domain protein [Tetrahymena thermophila SB210]|eukprot:XP_012652960.1 helicase carboxy-terminal domain protein [Tetrahymena thermophila SB210]
MPKDAFTCFFTSEAEISISQQLKQDQNLSSITNQWEQNFTLVDEYINSEIQNVDQFVEQIINLKRIDEQQITNFLNTKQELSKIDILYDLLPQAENLVKKLNGALQRAIAALLENVKLELISYQQNNVNEYYQKLLFLSDVIKDEKSIHLFIAQVMQNISNQMKKSESFLELPVFACQ